MKEIIIDNVNVAECVRYTKDNYCDLGGNCKGWDNCYFKQLQRLKKELEIKEKESEHFMIGSGEVLDKLRQENEELKKKINTYVCSTNCHKYIQANKYKNVLEKIRDIAKEFLKDLCDDCGWYNTDECNPEGYNCGEMRKIINKINEVLNAR